MPFIEYNSDEDAEREETRYKVRKYVELKKNLQQNDKIDVDETSAENEDDDRHDGSNVIPCSEFGKVRGYERDYISLSDPGSYEDTNKGLAAEDLKRQCLYV